MPANILPQISLKQTVRLISKIWAAMFAYLLLRSMLAALTGSAGTLALLDSGGIWIMYFGVPWIFLLPLLQMLLLRFPPLAARIFIKGWIYSVSLLMLVAAHALLISVFDRLGALLSVESLRDRAGSSSLTELITEEGFGLFDAALFTWLTAMAHFRLMQDKLLTKELDAFKLSRSLTDSRLQTLKMQLNPHFLFNSLNGVSVLIDKNENARARDMLGELSSFLRQTLRNPKEKWVSLAKELEFVKMYLNIEQYRFGKRLTYFEECEPLALEAKVPPMLLQPLFENAIVHGLADKQGPCRLSFECRLYDRYLIILIFDNGENFNEISDPLHKGGIGLSNIQDRLREVYGDNFSLGIEKKPDGTLVTLKLPSYKDSHF